MDVVDVEYLEDVVDAYNSLNIGDSIVHDVEARGELRQVGVGINIRIVFISEASPQGTEAKVFFQTSTAQHGDSAKEVATCFPREHELCVTIVDKLGGADKVERLVVNDIGEVGSWGEK